MIDKEKADMLLQYLARAAEKNSVQPVQEKAAKNICKIKNNSVEKLKKQSTAHELNNNCKNKSNNSFQDRLVCVEKKIDLYLHAEKSRAKRINEIEEKIKLRSALPAEKTKILNKTKKTLMRLQAQVLRLGKNKKSAELRARITNIKKHLKSLS